MRYVEELSKFVGSNMRFKKVYKQGIRNDKCLLYSGGMSLRASSYFGGISKTWYRGRGCSYVSRGSLHRCKINKILVVIKVPA